MSKKKLMVFAMAAILLFSQIITGCNVKTYNNEEDALVLSTADLDGVFNPFFATSGADVGVAGMTQVTMLTTDKNGGITYGENEDCVTLDYSEEVYDERPDPSNDEDYENYYSTYKFLLKDNIRFSDGTNLTEKDVLFNFYVYLDPAYTGSTTMYSTKIRGLSEYRNQSYDPNEYKNLEENFPKVAQQRMTSIQTWTETSSSKLANLSEQMKKDIKTIQKLYKEELYSDWATAAGMVVTYEDDAVFKEINNTWRAFLVLQGLIELVDKKNETKRIEWNGFKDFCAGLSDEQAKEKCVNEYYNVTLNVDLDASVTDDDLKSFKEYLRLVVLYSATKSTALTYFTAEVRNEHFNEIRGEDGQLLVKTISGIKVTTVNSFNGKTYNDGRKLLTIIIDGVDPKAKYNFSIPIAPLKYYAGTEYAAQFINDYDKDEHFFGVVAGDLNYMYDVIRAKDVPMGAGSYRASTEQSDTTNVTKGKFFANNVVYYVRNEYFHLGKPVIKKLRFQVFTRTQLIDSAALGKVHFVDPDAKGSNFTLIDKHKNLTAIPVDNLGYGYIGLNAKYIPDIKVRKAIMHAMNTALALEYYTNDMAKLVHRSMAKTSWAYPQDVTGPYYTYDKTGALSWALLEDTYSKGSDGILTDGKNKLSFTFTIAGEDDHPMYNTMINAAEILNKLGFDVKVVKDANALRKLASGLLQVWAAAWGSTIDPDLYQVYHMDSKASSTLNWGYNEIKTGNNNSYNTVASGETTILQELSELIEEGRKFLDEENRAEKYHRALDKIMELAIELPAYQRNNLFVYNNKVIDASTLTPDKDITAYRSPISKIWEVSLVTK